MGNGFIQIDRARAAIQLVGEVHELGACTTAGRQHLVHGLVRLVGGAIAAAVLDTTYSLELKGGIESPALAGFDDELIEVFRAHQIHGSHINPFHERVMPRASALRGQVFSATRDDIVARDHWDGSLWINEYARPARVDQFVCSMRVYEATKAMGYALMRDAHDRPFGDEDREVVHLVHLGVGPIYEVGSPRQRLAPRVRDTLDVLLTGASDKEIAAILRISPHTVRQYVKTILRTYGVSSRAQLIARPRG